MLLSVIKRGWVVFFIGLLSACGSGSTDPDPNETPDPKAVISAAPTMLKIEAKAGVNQLSWNIQPNVTYTLYHRLISAPSSAWLEVESGLTETSYEHPIVDSHLYEYAISAVNSGGESSKRTETIIIPQLWINGLSEKEGDEGVMTPFEFEATLNRVATQAVTVNYDTVEGSATEGDYSPIKEGEIKFEVGETLALISVSVVGDSEVESDESFNIRLSGAENVILGNSDLLEVTATILNDDEPPSPEITELSPLSVTLNTETDFTVKGQFLTDKIHLEIEDCSSPVLLEGGNQNQQQFRCTPSAVGKKPAKILAADNEVLKTFEIEVISAEDILATGKITQPVTGESYEGDIDIAANVTDEDGLKKVSAYFNSLNDELILCSNACSGNSEDWTKTVNPVAYGITGGSVTLELWVLDSNDKNILVDDVTFKWQPTSQNYSLPLNDTGVTGFFNAVAEMNEEPVDYPGQDARFGRDVTHNDDSDGHAGFSFTKLGSMGNDLSASALEWSCVRDNVTGLIWESKTDDGGIHDKDELFSWYTSDESFFIPWANREKPSALTVYKKQKNKSIQCKDYISGVEASYCNTEAYTERVNSVGLCGLNQWRMPDRRELISLLNSGRIDPSIDVEYFPYTASTLYWSSSPSTDFAPYAWAVDFYSGLIDGYPGGDANAVRLVHSNNLNDLVNK